jgi:Protein of unknown function, DUF481
VGGLHRRGLSFTSGNTDTSSTNLAYELKRDGGRPVVFLSKGLYIRGETDDELTVDKALLENRVDYRLTPRLSVFGQLGCLRDRFKEIEYLLSPTAGLSYLFVKGARVELSGDGGVGLVWEKNTGRDLETDGAVLAGEKLTITLSDTAQVLQSVAGLWKMDDFDDALYTFQCRPGGLGHDQQRAEGGAARHVQEPAPESGDREERRLVPAVVRLQVLTAAVNRGRD